MMTITMVTLHPLVHSEFLLHGCCYICLLILETNTLARV